MTEEKREWTIVFDGAWAHIEGPDLPSAVEQRIKRRLSWTDSAVEYQNRMYKWSQQDARRYCYDEDNRRFMAGFVPDVYAVMRDNGYTPNTKSVEPPRNPNRTLDLPFEFWVHQVDIIKELIRATRGIAQAPTGSGKSYAAAGYIHQFPRALGILVTAPSRNLMHNLKRAIETITDEEVGIVSGDDGHHWKRITVGVINSLALHAEKYREQLNRVEVMVFDECHHAASSMYQTLSGFCPNAYRRAGLSATAYRATGDHIILRGVIGGHVKNIPPDVMANRGIIMHPRYITVPCDAPKQEYKGAIFTTSRFTGKQLVTYHTDNNKPNHLDVYKGAVVNNHDRNIMIANMIESHIVRCEKSGPMLVLVNRLDHGKLLRKIMKEKLGRDVPFISAKGRNKKEREETIKKMRNGQLRQLIASGILNEGEDIPILEFLIIASGGSSERIITQQVGRVIRTSPVKQRAIVIDFYDEEKYYLRTHSRKRIRTIEGLYPGSHQRLTYDEAIELIQDPS